jgi:DNA-binding NarL/FixJ family response regulator
MHGDRTHVTQALRAGVAGYLLKGAAVAELPLALEAVMRGETYLTPKISQTVVREYLDARGETDEDPLKGLTARQREILHLIAEGRSTREMAGLLHVSVKTIETHRLRLMDRLDIHDVAGLVRFAVRTGIVSGAE